MSEFQLSFKWILLWFLGQQGSLPDRRRHRWPGTGGVPQIPGAKRRDGEPDQGHDRPLSGREQTGGPRRVSFLHWNSVWRAEFSHRIPWMFWAPHSASEIFGAEEFSHHFMLDLVFLNAILATSSHSWLIDTGPKASPAFCARTCVRPGRRSKISRSRSTLLPKGWRSTSRWWTRTMPDDLVISNCKSLCLFRVKSRFHIMFPFVSNYFQV